MRSGWRHILRIWLAKAAEPPSSIHALFKGYETAIRAAARIAVIRAPRIVLGFSACSNADDRDTNSQHEQQEPHSRLLGWPLSYKCLSFVFIPGLRDNARLIAANAAKLTELVRKCAELSRAVLPGRSAIYPSVRLLLSARSSL